MKIFSKSCGRSGPGFKTIVENHYRITLGRFEFALHVTTKAALKLRAEADAYQALKKQALAVAGDDDCWVEWGLEDIWDGEGRYPRRETAMSYLANIIETGIVPNKPKDAE